MDADSKEQLGNDPLLSVLSKIGGWAVIEGSKWNQNNFDLTETLISMKKMGQEHDLFAYLSIGYLPEEDYLLHIVVGLICQVGCSFHI